MTRLGWTLITVIATCCLAPPLTAQDASANRFEVATIKPPDPNMKKGSSIEIYPGGRVLLFQYSLPSLVGTAFRHSRAQIANNGGAWIQDEVFTVEAKAPASAGITNLNHSLFDIDDERLRQMLQTLLIERFQLKVRRETRTGDVYQLTRTSKALGLASFASTTMVRAPVVDVTNVSGSFDYRQPNPDLDPKYEGPEHATSFLQMLDSVGLELKRSRGPVEWLVIDSAARPTPD
jgi:Protein of unknown function (DUF3738).